MEEARPNGRGCDGHSNVHHGVPERLPPPVVQRAGKLRKARFAPSRWKVGKSGAARICYAYFEEYSVVLLVAIYDKTRTDDLTQEEKRQIKLLLERFENSLKRGQGRREKRDDSTQYQ